MRGSIRAWMMGASLLVAVLAGWLPAQEDGVAYEPPFLEAELAYSQALTFDYDRDGTEDRVQFWVRIEGLPSVGNPGEPGYRPESGSISYFVVDLKRKAKVENWLMGFNMGFPLAQEPYPIADIDIQARTARFNFQGTTWTLTDGGDTWRQDAIEIEDHRGTRPGRFYGGDVRVVPDPLAVVEPLDIAANRECNDCHMDAALAMAANGGSHRELDCASCHMEHPPDVETAVVPQCQGCHESHSEAMAAATCAECHSGHAVAKVEHGATMPDTYCAACHADVVATLRASRSLHMGVACVLCHQKEHRATTTCQYCHRGTHPEHVMQSNDICGACHNTAHDTERGRAN